MKLFRVSMCAVIALFFMACTHDDSTTREDNVTVALKNQSSNMEMPVVDNGILFFNDQAHIDQYAEFLSDMLHAEQENPNNSNPDAEVILDQFEAQFTGFTSFRQKFNQQYDFNNQGYSKQELLSIFEETYIKGLERSFFNEFFEVGIGTKVYVYYSEDVAFAFDKNNQTILNELRNMPKGIDDLPSVFLASHFQEIELISDNTEIGTKMHLDVDYNLAYDSFPVLQNKNCSVFEKALGMDLMETVKDNEGNIDSYGEYTSQFDSITIDWGDGSTHTVSYSTYSSELIWHTYTSTGTYTATVTIGFFDLNGDYQVMSDPISVVVAYACSEENGNVVDSDSDSQWLLVGELIVSNGFFGSSRIEGTSNAYRKNGSGDWERASGRRNKPYLKVYVSGIFRDDNCAVKSHKEGTAQSTHANQKIKTKSKLWNSYDHGNGDVYSEHRLQKGDSYLSVDLVFNPC